MTVDATEVSVAKPLQAAGTGPIYVAPAGTAAPTDATTKLASEFVSLGYVSEAGWSEQTNRETTEIKEWGGDIVLRPTVGYGETYSFGLLQTNEDVLEFVYGADNVTSGSGDSLAVLHNSTDLPRQVIVIETLMSDGKIKRKVIPDGQVTELGELQHTSGDAITYQITVSAFPDENRDYSADYFAKPVTGGGQG